MGKIGSLAMFVLLVFLAGCTVNLPFNNRLSYPYVKEAGKISNKQIGPIVIKWIPSTFPQRIDVQGASGFVGAASQTRIPTGKVLSERISEFLDTAIGIDNNSSKVLTINVINARTDFQYSASIFNITPGMDAGKCKFEAEFEYGGIKWKETFSAAEKDSSVGGSSQTGILEKVWDDVASQVGKNVIDHLSAISPGNK